MGVQKLHFRFLLWLCFLLGSPFLGHGQGGELLIQQYRRGPALNSNYSKFALSIGPQVNRINTPLSSTSPNISFGANLTLEYRISKTVGLVSGIGYTPIKYNYQYEDNPAKDALTYFSFPLLIRLNPTERVSINLGGHYSFFYSGYRLVETETNTLKTPYEKGIFKNNLGGIIQVGYHFLGAFYGYVNYRWARRTSPPLQQQTNDTSGFQVGVEFTFWKSKP